MSDEAIPVLRVKNAAEAVAWYGRLGYAKEWEHHFEPTFPAFVSIARDGFARIYLSEHAGDGGMHTLVFLRVSDVDVVAKEFDAEVVEQTWGREVHLVDPDGNRLRVSTPGT